MVDSTATYGLPYPESTDPPEIWTYFQDLAEAVDDSLGDVVTALTPPTQAAQSATATQPLVSSAGVDTAVISKSYAFKTGWAYKISYSYRVQFTGGTSPFILNHKIKRVNASGTTMFDAGGTAAITTNFVAIDGWCIVKCTAGDTTQTIVATAAFGGSGAPTSIDLEAASTNRKTLLIERLGPSSDFADAIEVPTA